MPERKPQKGIRNGWEIWKQVSIEPINPIINKAIEIRNNVKPEYEFLIGALATAESIIILVNPSLLPPYVEEIVNSLENNIPGFKINRAIGTIALSGITVDGAVRMAKETIPSVKGMINFYIEEIKDKIGK